MPKPVSLQSFWDYFWSLPHNNKPFLLAVHIRTIKAIYLPDLIIPTGKTLPYKNLTYRLSLIRDIYQGYKTWELLDIEDQQILAILSPNISQLLFETCVTRECAEMLEEINCPLVLGNFCALLKLPLSLSAADGRATLHSYFFRKIYPIFNLLIDILSYVLFPFLPQKISDVWM
jgi:hypothetical protein